MAPAQLIGRREREVAEEFDRILLAGGIDRDRLGPYEARMLDYAPESCGTALDIGCGTGKMTRLLARRCGKVVGVDLSPEMIRQAREATPGASHIEYHVGNALDWLETADRYDCIAAMAALHHMPLERTLDGIKRSLKRGGVLVIVDLIDRRGLKSLPANLLAYLIRLVSGQSSILRPDVRAAWRDHSVKDVHLTIHEARALLRTALPGAIVRHHLLWRYSLVWKKI